jgi:hypothetical protein
MPPEFEVMAKQRRTVACLDLRASLSLGGSHVTDKKDPKHVATVGQESPDDIARQQTHCWWSVFGFGFGLKSKSPRGREAVRIVLSSRLMGLPLCSIHLD